MNVEAVIKTNKKIPVKSRTIIHMFLINNKISEQLTKALKPYDVSIQQFNVLRILRGQKDTPANLSTINERMINKMSNTTRLVDKLIQKGYVERSVCESNRRKVDITITPEGKKCLEQMDRVMKETEEGLLEDFSLQELDELNQLLNKF